MGKLSFYLVIELGDRKGGLPDLNVVVFGDFVQVFYAFDDSL